MADRLQFKEKLDSVCRLAEKQGGNILLEDVQRFFEEDCLSEEQINLVCDFLLAQKMTVTGYVQRKTDEEVQDGESEGTPLSNEEQIYVEEYLRTLDQMTGQSKEEIRMAYFLPKVVEEAIRLHQAEMFIGDMIQEGNVSLMLALRKIPQGAEEEEAVLEAIRNGILAMAASQNERKQQDNRIVEKVNELDKAIREMKEELGRKVSVDEVSERLGISEDEVENILKLAGEEVSDE